jgi:hypothetical protein
LVPVFPAVVIFGFGELVDTRWVAGDAFFAAEPTSVDFGFPAVLVVVRGLAVSAFCEAPDPARTEDRADLEEAVAPVTLVLADEASLGVSFC